MNATVKLENAIQNVAEVVDTSRGHMNSNAHKQVVSQYRIDIVAVLTELHRVFESYAGDDRDRYTVQHRHTKTILEQYPSVIEDINHKPKLAPSPNIPSREWYILPPWLNHLYKTKHDVNELLANCDHNNNTANKNSCDNVIKSLKFIICANALVLGFELGVLLDTNPLNKYIKRVLHDSHTVYAYRFLHYLGMPKPTASHIYRDLIKRFEHMSPPKNDIIVTSAFIGEYRTKLQLIDKLCQKVDTYKDSLHNNTIVSSQTAISPAVVVNATPHAQNDLMLPNCR
jgi:hypothetical protein